MLYLAEEKYSSSTINQHHFAIRFLYDRVLKKKAFRMEQKLHKRPERVPIVPAREEVHALFRATPDLQQRTIWMTLYSSGMRLSEALRLQVPDIDSKDMRILVRNGKGRKDRYTVLSQSLVLQLRSYYRVYRPTEWMFFGRDRECHLVLRSVQKAFKQRGQDTSRHPQTDYSAQLAARFRHAFDGGWRQSALHPGHVGPSGHPIDSDLPQGDV